MECLKGEGIHLILLNVNNLLPKIDEIRYIAVSTDVAVIRISESKLVDIILQLKIQICNYELLWSDRNRNSGDINCYIRSDIGYLQKYFFPKENENMSVKVLLRKTKPVIAGIIHRSPKQNNFFQIVKTNFDKLDTNTCKSRISLVILI